MSKKEDSLLSAMDDAARELLKFINPPTMDDGTSGGRPQGLDSKDRVEAFKAVTAYLAVKFKIEPEGVKASGIDKYRAQLNGRTDRRGASGKASSESGSADADNA